MSAVRKWSRPVHRDLSFFFSGVLLIYAVSGFMLNHKRDFNSDYSVRRTELVFAQEIPRAEQEWTRARAEELLLRVGEEGNYLKHYFPEPDRLKVFIRGGSSLTVDLASGHAVYESIRKRPVLSSLNRLHYNPSRWWTVFSDVFLAGLIVIVLSGLVMMPPRSTLFPYTTLFRSRRKRPPFSCVWVCCHRFAVPNTSSGTKRKSPNKTTPTVCQSRPPGDLRRMSA
mgnify:CR=1 FL=1